VLDKVGVKETESIEIVFDGADGPVVDKTPDFIKSIPVWKAMEDSTLIAYEMNGQPLPLQRFSCPDRRPGLDRHLLGQACHFDQGGDEARNWILDEPGISNSSRQVLARCAIVSQETAGQCPDHRNGGELANHELSRAPALKLASPITIGGIAITQACITTVDLSTDAGKTWQPAKLGKELGRFAFRTFAYSFTPRSKGRRIVMARAANKIGQTQTSELILNPAGYHHNLIHRVAINVA
jgi:hypothetical protein